MSLMMTMIKYLFLLYGICSFFSCGHGCGAFTFSGHHVSKKSAARSKNNLRSSIVGPRVEESRSPCCSSATSRRLRCSARSENNDDEYYEYEEDGKVDEEVLLRVNLSTTATSDGTNTSSKEDILNKLRDYVRSFPFAAVLPVQPLQYVPSELGVDVTFLRKKTKEKGSVDGGIRVDVVAHDDDDSVRVTARRNSEGQTVSKIFSEKIVVQSLLKGIDDARSDIGVSIESVFHKWL